MATKVITVLVDDLDGSEADTTLSFRFDGKDYEIDLSAQNLARLEELLAPYVAAGRKLPRATRKAAKAQDRLAQKDATTSNIRDWAIRNGYTTSTRGRIPAQILEAHERASV